jgi:hypothetical protein
MVTCCNVSIESAALVSTFAWFKNNMLTENRSTNGLTNSPAYKMPIARPSIETLSRRRPGS